MEILDKFVKVFLGIVFIIFIVIPILQEWSLMSNENQILIFIAIILVAWWYDWSKKN